ncbi:MAG TPA: hypothetical protein VN033_14260 [Vulgatibacter sp.]|nr:hypothetical protein [Vulgatibacter sp.]
MRYGFFYGIGGELGALERVLARLRDCDRIVSLGDLWGGAEDREAWERFEALGERGIALSGPGERARAKDRSIPLDLRLRLRALPSSTVEDGIAILGPPAPTTPGRRELAATGGAPRLVAPLTIGAHPGATRLWRSAGGLARVSEPSPDATLPLGGERLWLELGRRPACAVVDLDRGVLMLRDPSAPAEALAAPAAPRLRSRRRRMVDARQCLLAV